ncbi:MAG: Clp protease ClpP [Oscillospiraceae bacterium]|nr:Clp protease ClpP [Oscillospiraceae bacterium]
MNPKTTKFWNISSIDNDSAEIILYGDICDSQPTDWWTGEPVPGLFITPEGFLEDLAAIKDKSKITVKINSCGGDLYTGIAIHNALKGLSGHKTVIVEGIAASAASVIMCAGDEVQVYPGSMVMIHGVAGLFYDFMSMSDLKLALKAFDAAEKAIAEIYSEKTGTEVEVLRSMMTEETWMVGAEAVENNFADTVLDGLDGKEREAFISNDKKVLLVAGVRHDVKGFRNIPVNIPVSNSITAVEKTVVNKSNKGGKTLKTIEELKAAYPDLVTQIENTAVKAAVDAERKRISDIEAIASAVGDDALVNEAKFGETPLTAQELSFAALQKQSKIGAAHLAAVRNDYAASGAVDVGTAPHGGELKDSESETSQSEMLAKASAEVKSLLGKESKV